MTTINAENYGISPDTEIGEKLYAMLKELSEINDSKLLIFTKGSYNISSETCQKVYRAITNTTAKDEYSDKNEIGMHRTPFLLENISDLTLDGNGSTFVIDGKVTNMIISSCKNITIKNIQIKTKDPNVHKVTVEKCDTFSAVFSLGDNCSYVKRDGKFYWTGTDYELDFEFKKQTSFWPATIKPETPDTIARIDSPFRYCISIKEIEKNKIEVKYAKPVCFAIGQTFYLFDAHRSDVGIFLEKSQDVTLTNVEQNFNYSLAYVAQDCKNLTVTECRFAPEKDTDRKVASLADFMQVCMCSGEVKFSGNYFDGACDDALNVHGIHFKVDSVNGNIIRVSFRHEQTWGFNPLHDGDKIEFINPSTMLSVGENKIVNSKMIDDYTIELTLEKAPDKKCTSWVIEDITQCPSLIFENNTLIRIITRGILYTSRGKAEIRNNHFISNTMSGILLSDDAKNWYESGMCKDVAITGNTFDYCGQTPILIKPENSRHRGYVHSNIVLKNNIFGKYDGECVFARSTENLEICNNTFSSKNIIKSKHCKNVRLGDNIIK